MARPACLLVTAFLVPLSASLAQAPQDTITLAAARSALGANPVAVPDLPIRSFHQLTTGIILVEQKLSSGEVVVFREWRGRPGRLPEADSNGAAFDALNGRPLPAERRMLDRRRLRWFGGLGVEVMSNDESAIALLDRLQPIKT